MTLSISSALFTTKAERSFTYTPTSGRSLTCTNGELLSTTTTTRLTSVISTLMRVRRSPHDATPSLLSVHCHPWPHILHILNQPRSPSHPWPAPTSAARHFQVPTSAHPIIHLLPLDMLEPPQSETKSNQIHTLGAFGQEFLCQRILIFFIIIANFNTVHTSVYMT